MHRNGLITNAKNRMYEFLLLSLKQKYDTITFRVVMYLVLYLNSMCKRIGAQNINDIVSLKPVLVLFFFYFYLS